jgi:hypothetical protein
MTASILPAHGRSAQESLKRSLDSSALPRVDYEHALRGEGDSESHSSIVKVMQPKTCSGDDISSRYRN